MDYFGYTLWTELIMGHPDWFTSLQLGDPNEMDPEGDFWPNIFNGLKKVMTESALTPEMGACLHISYAMGQQMTNQEHFDILPHYRAAMQEFQKDIPFELGLHMTFNDDVNPLGCDYKQTFLKDLENARILGATTMVVHPVKNWSYPRKEIMDLMVNDATLPEINEALRKSNIIIAWENMIEGQFSSLEQLVMFREKLTNKLIETGNKDLVDKHQLCLDTGHLLIWRANHPSLALAEKEIDTYLPQFAKNIKVFHIHANDGTSDFHITPHSTQFMTHKTRQGLNLEKFQACSQKVNDWIKICNQYATQPNRHIHLETDKVPFTLEQTIEFGKIYKTLK
jgi:sugar phosphate isomerase/epimerase